MNRFQLEMLLEFPKEAYSQFLSHIDVSLDEFDIIDAEITHVPLTEHARSVRFIDFLSFTTQLDAVS